MTAHNEQLPQNTCSSSLLERVEKLEQETLGQLAETRQQLAEIRGQLAETRQQLDETRGQLAETRQQLGEELAQTRQQFDETRQQLDETRQQLAETRQQLAEDRQRRPTQALETQSQPGKRKKASDKAKRVVKRQADKSSAFCSCSILKVTAQSPSTETIEVLGVTKMDESIYVLVCGSTCKPVVPAFSVYKDTKPFHFQQTTTLNEITLRSIGEYYVCVSLLSCNKFRCFYIHDKESRCIWKITADDNRVTKWLSRENRNYRESSSVSKDGYLSLLILHCSSNKFTYGYTGLASLSGNEEPTNKVEIYDGSGANAKLVRRISLPTDIEYPICAIQKPTGQIVICCISHGDNESGPHIFQLNSDRQITSQFRLTHESKEFYCPELFCLDSETGRLFVLYNEKVYIFDSTSFQFNETLSNESCFVELGATPEHMCYDETRKQLIVGFDDLRILEVYQLR